MTTTAWLTVLLGGLLTYLIRAVFPLLADRARDVPPLAQTALRMIPPAALAALVAPPFLRPDGPVDVASPELLAGLLAGLAAWRWRNVPLTLAVGFSVLLALT